MSFPMDQDEKMCMKHAKNLRRRAYEWELKGLRSWQKRLGQRTRRDEALRELRTDSMGRE